MPWLSWRTSPRRIEDVRLFVNPRHWLTWPCSVVFIAVYNKCVILLSKWVTLNAAPCIMYIYIYLYKGWTCFSSTSMSNVTCLSSWFIVVEVSKYQVIFTCRFLLVLCVTPEYYRPRICTYLPGLLSYNVISERTGEGRRCRSSLKNRASSMLVLVIVGK